MGSDERDAGDFGGEEPLEFLDGVVRSSKEALEADGAHEAAAETHAQLDELLATLDVRG